MISELNQLLTTASKIVKIILLQMWPQAFLKQLSMNSTSTKEKITERDQHGHSQLKSPLWKRGLSIPSQNVSHNTLIWARNLHSSSQKMMLVTQWYLMIKELQGLLKKQKGMLHPGSKQIAWPWRDVLVDEWEMGIQRYKDWSWWSTMSLFSPWQ